MSADTMRAIRFHAYGPPEQLVVEEVARPEPGEGQVLVRVHIAGVNPVDWKLRSGALQAFMPVTLPLIPGNELAGVVAAVGPGAGAFAIGQRVFGRASQTYAEYAVAQAENLTVMPDALSFEQAATIPVGGSTAWAGLFDVGGLQAGQRLLVLGAAGGVGAYAAQLGRWKGAQVYGTSSAANLDYVRSLGVDEALDYNTPALEQVHEIDIVLDTVGGEAQAAAWDTLKPGGILVAVAGMAPVEAATEHGVRTANVRIAGGTGEIQRQIADLVASGTLVAPVSTIYALSDAAAAQRQSESRHGRGRIVLRVAE